MVLHQFEIGFEQRRTAVAVGQRGEAAKLLGELRRTVGASLFQVIDTEKAVLVQSRLPHVGLEPLALGQRGLTKMVQEPNLILVP